MTLTYTRPLDVIEALINAHVDWLDRYYAAGAFLASGRQVPRIGGVILAGEMGRDALEAILAEDPFHRSGAARYEVVEFTVTRVADGVLGLS